MFLLSLSVMRLSSSGGNAFSESLRLTTPSCIAGLNRIPGNCVGRILFNSWIMAWVFRPSVLDSIPTRSLYFCCSFATNFHRMSATYCSSTVHYMLVASMYIENTYVVLPYIKKSNEVGRIDNFRALARKLSFLPTELIIFDIR